MNYLTNYYKNLCEQLQERVQNLENMLNEVKITKVMNGKTVSWDPNETTEEQAEIDAGVRPPPTASPNAGRMVNHHRMLLQQKKIDEVERIKRNTRRRMGTVETDPINNPDNLSDWERDPVSNDDIEDNRIETAEDKQRRQQRENAMSTKERAEYEADKKRKREYGID